MVTQIVWLGASAFRIITPAGHRLYIDPFLNNGDCPPEERSPTQVDIITISHGHFDHVGQSMDLWKKFRPSLVASQDLRRWLQDQGLERDDRLGPDIGGTVRVDDVAITLTDARHGAAAPDHGYGGTPCGNIISIDGGPTIYFAGDTGVFGDMALIAELWKPDIAILPIGGHYTMDPRQAAHALKLLDTKVCIPCHFRAHKVEPVSATRAALTGTPRELRELVPSDILVIDTTPGQILEF